MTNFENTVTKKELNKVFLRWATTCQIAWNYETMQSGGVVYSLQPALRKIYKNDDEYKEALLSHYTFFNTQPFVGNIVLGAIVAMEEQPAANKEEKREAITSIKTGLMGPLAGVGDAIFFVIPLTIFNAIAAYMGLAGNPWGISLGILCGFAFLFIRYWFFNMGYKQGSKFVSSLSSQLKSLTNSANILGMTVIGALIGSVISVNIPLEFVQGEVVTKLQDTLDMIMPNLVPALLVGFIYWLLGRKNMTSTRAILVVILISFVFYITGVMA
ncbi:PTS system mannose/fructose/sorbose family transporter subunit IID [Erysipelothrix sp. HDW6C]|uniref:PTS system mannose/fructose/sorbose family transporter subunit IID n=1 Tax=Erysipelothrix sp. HDW6C TaxID=2714930 RepID=UPI00140B2DB7|nr:PTS system mannose/fructose/sorbose family transporter subunit IID [Erysipelothrix sp. HDW6C]QIK70679.1 PTS system mannose/fructose/sorbose family transporter subunit IID [Erysipelothrix sp. HDW6C]